MGKEHEMCNEIVNDQNIPHAASQITLNLTPILVISSTLKFENSRPPDNLCAS